MESFYVNIAKIERKANKKRIIPNEMEEQG